MSMQVAIPSVSGNEGLLTAYIQSGDVVGVAEGDKDALSKLYDKIRSYRYKRLADGPRQHESLAEGPLGCRGTRCPSQQREGHLEAAVFQL